MSERRKEQSNGFPVEETAPTLDYYKSPEPQEPFHVSELTPDPEAQVDLSTWAKLYHQMTHLSEWGKTPALGETPESLIHIDFPVAGLHVGNMPVTWLTMSAGGALENETGVVEGRHQTSVFFDLTRPGVITVSDIFITVPEAMPKTTHFEAVGEPKEVKSGLYMAKDGASVAFTELEYEVGNTGAESMIELLRNASPIDLESDLFEERFEQSTQRMDPSVAEACHRFFVLHKNLIRSPEEVFHEEWGWGSTPTQIGDSMGLHAWVPKEYAIYTPPGHRASDAKIAFDFLEAEGKSSWTKTVWNRESLPDNFQPLFEEPSKLKALSLEEIVEDIPEEHHVYLARYCAVGLRRLANSIRAISADCDTAQHRQKYATKTDEYIRLFPKIAKEYPPAKLEEWRDYKFPTLEDYSEETADDWERIVCGNDLMKLPPIPNEEVKKDIT
jgi:hypothetical protein